MQNKFPKRYIKHGMWELHSGQYSKVLYDVNAMLTDFHECMKIIKKIPSDYDTYVGIATGGAIITSHLGIWRNWAMIKDEELKGEIIGTYCLIDDVCTTENSIKDAIRIIGKKPAHIFVVVDRRKEKTLKIESMYKVQ